MKEVIWISLLGAGLVVIGLILLWFLMDALVKITAEKKKASGEKQSNTFVNLEIESEHRRVAAAIAVSIALLNSPLQTSVDQSGKTLAAWQIANRFRQLNNLPHAVSLKRKDK